MDALTASLESTHRRRSLRRAVRVEAEVTSELWDEAVSLVATDLSLHGVWLESDLPLDTGSEVSISIFPPQWPRSMPLRICGRVARVGMFRRRSDSGRPGMGVSFDLSAEQSRTLRRALQGLPPRLPLRMPMRARVPPLSSLMSAIVSVARQ